MGNNTSTAGTAHVKLLAGKALESAEGISVMCNTQRDAVRLRGLFNSMRHKDRAEARKMYPADDPRYGQSFYDPLETIIQQEGSKWKFSLRNLMAGLGELEIIDNATGERIAPEELKYE